MKRTKNIRLIALSAVATATLLGCSNAHYDEQKNCVDQNGVVVPDVQCEVGNPGYHPGHYWYYGGNRLFGLGSTVSGGSRNAIPGRIYYAPGSSHFNSSPSVTRGGFGSSVKGGGISAGS